jgi:cytoskeletal protein RodZ
MSIFRRLVVAVATVAMVLLFGASGAHASPALAAGLAETHEPGHEDDSSEDDSSEDDNSEDDNSDEDSEDEDDNSDEDNSDEDNESDDPTDEPTEQPTFTEPPTTDTTDGVTEMPTSDAEPTSEAGASPLGWILLAGGVACAAAAIAVYRRNRHIM